jgi:hypothetical protein
MRFNVTTGALIGTPLSYATASYTSTVSMSDPTRCVSLVHLITLFSPSSTLFSLSSHSLQLSLHLSSNLFNSHQIALFSLSSHFLFTFATAVR